MTFLEANRLSASYGATPVLRDVSFVLARGQVKGLIGPSGSGKSSVLRAIVGLLHPSSGTVKLDGTVVDYGNPSSLRGMRDRIAIVFQQYNLFQNMTAIANVSFAPIMAKRRPRGEAEAEAEMLLRKVGLGDHLHRYPDQLSGGQQQRVAIARALALKPELLLLDEITSALDPELVNEVLDTVALLAADGMTMLIVSHEMTFIREVASELLLLDGGQLIETGAPEIILNNPSTERGRRFAEKAMRQARR